MKCFDKKCLEMLFCRGTCLHSCIQIWLSFWTCPTHPSTCPSTYPFPYSNPSRLLFPTLPISLHNSYLPAQFCHPLPSWVSNKYLIPNKNKFFKKSCKHLNDKIVSEIAWQPFMWLACASMINGCHVRPSQSTFTYLKSRAEYRSSKPLCKIFTWNNPAGVEIQNVFTFQMSPLCDGNMSRVQVVCATLPKVRWTRKSSRTSHKDCIAVMLH